MPYRLFPTFTYLAALHLLLQLLPSCHAGSHFAATDDRVVSNYQIRTFSDLTTLLQDREVFSDPSLPVIVAVGLPQPSWPALQKELAGLKPARVSVIMIRCNEAGTRLGGGGQQGAGRGQGRAHRGAAHHGTAQHGMAHHDSAHHGAVQHGAAQHGAVQHGAVQHGMAHRDSAHHGVVQHGAAQHGAVQHGMAHHGAAQHGVVQHGAAQHGAVQHGMAHHGAAQHGVVQHGAAHHDAAQHGAAQHGTAQHDAAHQAGSHGRSRHHLGGWADVFGGGSGRHLQHQAQPILLAASAAAEEANSFPKAEEANAFPAAEAANVLLASSIYTHRRSLLHAETALAQEPSFTQVCVKNLPAMVTQLDSMLESTPRVNVLAYGIRSAPLLMSNFLLTAMHRRKSIARFAMALQKRDQVQQVSVIDMDSDQRVEYRVSELHSVFQDIYDRKVWSDAGFGSGLGSTMEFTDVLRKELVPLLVKLGIRTMVDAPCGGMLWMPPVLEQVEAQVQGFKYWGLDVSCGLIKSVKDRMAGHENWHFACMDVTSSTFPVDRPDLVFTRDALQHLPYDSIHKFLLNVKRHNAKYLLVGSYINGTDNKDIKPGGYFSINLLEPPFNMRPKPLKIITEGTSHHPNLANDPPKFMLLMDVAAMQWDKPVAEVGGPGFEGVVLRN